MTTSFLTSKSIVKILFTLWSSTEPPGPPLDPPHSATVYTSMSSTPVRPPVQIMLQSCHPFSQLTVSNLHSCSWYPWKSRSLWRMESDVCGWRPDTHLTVKVLWPQSPGQQWQECRLLDCQVMTFELPPGPLQEQQNQIPLKQRKRSCSQAFYADLIQFVKMLMMIKFFKKAFQSCNSIASFIGVCMYLYCTNASFFKYLWCENQTTGSAKMMLCKT